MFIFGKNLYFNVCWHILSGKFGEKNVIRILKKFIMS